MDALQCNSPLHCNGCRRVAELLQKIANLDAKLEKKSGVACHCCGSRFSGEIMYWCVRCKHQICWSCRYKNPDDDSSQCKDCCFA